MLFRNALSLVVTASLWIGGAKAQFDVSPSIFTELDVSSTTGPPVTSTSTLELSFFHDNVDTSGSYAVKYYYEGCINEVPTSLLSSGGGPFPVYATSFTSVPVPAPYDSETAANQCGVDEDQQCAAQTLYSFVLQDLSDISNSAIKSVSGTTSTVKFCVRHQIFDTATTPVERGYQEADLVITWTTDEGFSTTAVTSVNGPVDETIDLGDITVTAELCSDLSPGTIPTVYNQGEQVQVCISTSTTSAASIALVIVSVDELRYWIDNPVGPNTNGVYDVGEITQVGITGGAVQGTTTIVPDLATATNVCNEAFGTTYIDPSTLSGCVVTTFLSEDFFFESTINADGDNIVNIAGTVTVEFNNGNRRQLQLVDGQTFPKSFDAQIAAVPTSDDGDAGGDDDEDDEGFWAWLFSCFGLF